MNPKEQRVSDALDAYTALHGDGSFPGVDSLPDGYDDPEKLAKLLEACLAQGKQIHELVEVREDDPDVLY